MKTENSPGDGLVLGSLPPYSKKTENYSGDVPVLGSLPVYTTTSTSPSTTIFTTSLPSTATFIVTSPPSATTFTAISPPMNTYTANSRPIPTKAPDGSLRFCCDQCTSSFRRPEHLRRHQRDHLHDRPFGCETCGKRFSRNDTLQRHKQIHTFPENTPDGDNGARRGSKPGPRTNKACVHCATSRSRCSGGAPCVRCKGKALECEYLAKRRRTVPSMVARSASEGEERSPIEPTAAREEFERIRAALQQPQVDMNTEMPQPRGGGMVYTIQEELRYHSHSPQAYTDPMSAQQPQHQHQHQHQQPQHQGYFQEMAMGGSSAGAPGGSGYPHVLHDGYAMWIPATSAPPPQEVAFADAAGVQYSGMPMMPMARVAGNGAGMAEGGYSGAAAPHGAYERRSMGGV